MESYKHQFAKQTLARWLADPEQRLLYFRNAGGGPYGCGVFLEYPFCLDGDGNLHGETPWDETGIDGISLDDAPTYQQCLDAKLLPICIFDVAVQHKGIVTYAFEIVHKHGLTDIKRQYIDRIDCVTDVYGLDADWVLSQVQRPRKLKTLWHLTTRY